MCHVCEYECGIGESLSDFRCCWCQWTVHEKCLHNLADLCILGTYRNFIIPPNCITLRTSRRARLQSQCIVSNIRVPKSAGLQWSPLIVIGEWNDTGFLFIYFHGRHFAIVLQVTASLEAMRPVMFFRQPAGC